jgi:hypothetical protein
MANAFVHGKLSTVTIGGTAFAVVQETYEEGLSDLTDITFTTAGGATFRVLLPGYNLVDGTLTFIYDTLNQPILSPQNMIPGTLITPLVVSPDGTKLFSFNAYAAKFTWAGGPRNGPVQCTVPYQSSGAITRPAS